MVKIYEVGPRDGFQGLPKPIPTAAKVELIGMLTEAGLPYIEVGSFPSPKTGKLYENMKDTAEVFRQLRKSCLDRYGALVFTPKYFEQALAAGFRRIAVVISASEEHQKANMGRTVAEGAKEIDEIYEKAYKNCISVRPYIATAFGYKRPDDVTEAQLRKLFVDVAMNTDENGVPRSGRVYNVSLGDTFGLARYDEFFMNKMWAVIYDDNRLDHAPTIALHLHQGNPDIWKFLTTFSIGKLDVTDFDTSIGGLGGCPTDSHMGNIPTEEFVDYLEANEIDTGIDADKVHKAAEFVKKLTKSMQ